MNRKKVFGFKKRKFLFCLAAVVSFAFVSILVLLIFLSETDYSKKKFVFKLSEVHSDDYPTALADKEFARRVYERSGGRIKIEVYTDGRLYSDEPDALKSLMDGELDFARISSAPIGRFVPKLNIIQLPLICRDTEHFLKVITGPIGKSLLDSVEKANVGIVGLCFYNSGARSLYLKNEIHKIEDLQGMKIRIQISPTMNELLECCGASGVVGIGTHEVYDKILNGIVDGAENNIPTYQSMGDYLAAPFYVRTEHARVPDILLASSSTFSKLSEADVELIRECALESEAFQFEQWEKKEKSSLDIVKQVANVVDLPDEERAKLEEKSKMVYKKYEGEYGDLIREILASE